MTDRPDYLLIRPLGVAVQFPAHPYVAVVLPPSVTIDDLNDKPSLCGCFLIDRDCGFDVLNGVAFSGYLQQGIAIRLHAQRARDLRPFLQRREALAKRGYTVEMLS